MLPGNGASPSSTPCNISTSRVRASTAVSIRLPLTARETVGMAPPHGLRKRGDYQDGAATPNPRALVLAVPRVNSTATCQTCPVRTTSATPKPFFAAITSSIALLTGACLSGGPPGASSSEATAVVLSEAGDKLGPISADTPFDAVELRALFPGHTVTEAVGHAEGDAFRELRIEADDGPLLALRSDRGAILSVEIFELAALRGSIAGHGDRFSEAFPDGPGTMCEPGMEEESGKVVCSPPRSSHLMFVFEGAWDGPDGVLPPADVLGDWTIRRVIWLP